jgi:hypothetical protein
LPPDAHRRLFFIAIRASGTSPYTRTLDLEPRHDGALNNLGLPTWYLFLLALSPVSITAGLPWNLGFSMTQSQIDGRHGLSGRGSHSPQLSLLNGCERSGEIRPCGC